VSKEGAKFAPEKRSRMIKLHGQIAVVTEVKKAS
jgi:hypothetical protein